MPKWLQVVATVNPLSYMVSALRALILPGQTANLLLDFTVLFVGALFMSVISAWLYPKVII
jgi:ABC-2 type transport system permease protein